MSTFPESHELLRWRSVGNIFQDMQWLIVHFPALALTVALTTHIKTGMFHEV